MATNNIWQIGDTVYLMHYNKIKKGVVTDFDSEEDEDNRQSYRVKFPGFITWVHKNDMHRSIDDLITNLKLTYANESAT